MFDLHGDAASLGADPRVDDREYHTLGEILDRAYEGERPRPDVEGRDLVGDVDDAQFGADVEHDRVTDTDELVRTAVVRQERYEWRTVSHDADATPETNALGKPRRDRSRTRTYPVCLGVDFDQPRYPAWV